VTVEIESVTVVNDPSDPYLAAYAARTGETIGRPVEWITSNAGHDGRHFAKYGVPLAVGYPAGANHHGQDEYLEKTSLQFMQQIFHRYLLTVARKPSRAKRRLVPNAAGHTCQPDN
jgi:succinyl-diaminopimelate desuccinylase